MRLRQILCAVVHDETSRNALDHAAWLATTCDAGVRLFHPVDGSSTDLLETLLGQVSDRPGRGARISAAANAEGPDVGLSRHAELTRADLTAADYARAFGAIGATVLVSKDGAFPPIATPAYDVLVVADDGGDMRDPASRLPQHLAIGASLLVIPQGEGSPQPSAERRIECPNDHRTLCCQATYSNSAGESSTASTVDARMPYAIAN